MVEFDLGKADMLRETGSHKGGSGRTPEGNKGRWGNYNRKGDGRRHSGRLPLSDPNH